MILTIKNIHKIVGVQLHTWSVYSWNELEYEYEFDCVNLLDGNFRKVVLIRKPAANGHFYFSRRHVGAHNSWSSPYSLSDLSTVASFTRVLDYEIDFVENGISSSPTIVSGSGITIPPAAGLTHISHSITILPNPPQYINLTISTQ